MEHLSTWEVWTVFAHPRSLVGQGFTPVRSRPRGEELKVKVLKYLPEGSGLLGLGDVANPGAMVSLGPRRTRGQHPPATGSWNLNPVSKALSKSLK
jgi:hypothetical protein